MSLRNVALPCFQFCSAACQFNCPLISPSSIRSWLWLAHQLNTICLSVFLLKSAQNQSVYMYKALHHHQQFYSVVDRWCNCKKWMLLAQHTIKNHGNPKDNAPLLYFCIQWVDNTTTTQIVRPLLCRWGFVKRKRLTKRPRTNRVRGKKEKPFQFPQLVAMDDGHQEQATAMQDQSNP